MYFAPVTVEACDRFLGGFVTGCLACGVRDAFVRVHDAMRRRDWIDIPRGAIPGMRQNKMSEEEIIDELIAIHIEAFQPRCGDMK
jgi:hypothetical protein